ncbi:MAG: hypothetical protein R3C53_02645 [Pirellulaceae bacterium]
MLYRHGDVLIMKVSKVPAAAKKQQHLRLAEGEVTGHSHRVLQAGAAILFRDQNALFLEVTADRASIVHEEHATIDLPRGLYRVWQQREYTPERIITVRD